MNKLEKYTDEDLMTIINSDIEQELLNRGYKYGWYKKEPFVGVIYILVNSAFPNLVKIGYADDIRKRLKQLNSNSGLPDPFHVYATYAVKKRLEDLKLHSLIDSLDSDLRHSKNREFYEMTAEKAYNILLSIAQINGNEERLVLNPLSDYYFPYNLTPIHPSAPSYDGKGNPESSPIIPSTLELSNHSSKIIPDGIYHLHRKIKRENTTAEATIEVKDEKVILKKGSYISPTEGAGLKERIRNIRNSIQVNNDILQEDVSCSLNEAAGIVLGASCNAWTAWHNANEELIDIYR